MKNTLHNAQHEQEHVKQQYRWKLWRHEVQSVIELGEVIQKAEQAMRVLSAARVAATGLALSPYVRAASALEGVQVVLGDANPGTAGEMSDDNMNQAP